MRRGRRAIVYDNFLDYGNFNLTPISLQKVSKEKSRDTRRVEEELADLLMAEVEVRIKKQVKRHGKREDMGEVAIAFGSMDELNGLIEWLRGGK